MAAPSNDHEPLEHVEQSPPAVMRNSETSWAPRISTLTVSEVPTGAVNLNVEGRRVVSPLQGFGQLWQKTYRIRFEGVQVTPQEVVSVWKAHFPEFHPPQNRFYPSIAGMKPGEVVLINASVQGLPVDAGVMVLYADDESFTVMTPEGFPEAGWNTFSAYDDDGVTVAQVQSMARANDPIYEISFRLFASKAQEGIWAHVLTQLAARFGVQGEVTIDKVCVDPKVQWSEAKNVWQNAGARTMLYLVLTPVRWVRTRIRSRGKA